MARVLIKTHSSSGIGSTMQAMLDEAQFQTVHGTGWVMMDGRSVVGSDYEAVTGDSTIPDARGQFLRAKNNGRSDGNEDNAGERTLGDFQSELVGEIIGEQANVSQSGTAVVTSALFHANGLIIQQPYTHNVGQQNRPNNVAVNTFIKINEI